MTQQEFNEMFLTAMETYGKAQEDTSENGVPVLDATALGQQDLNAYSLPMTKWESGSPIGYAQAEMGALIEAIAQEAADEHDVLTGVTEAELDEIFPLSGSSSSSD